MKDLTFSIATTKQTFLPLEPIPFLMTVKNNTTEPITTYIDLSFTGRHLKLFVQKPNEPEIEIRQLSYMSDGGGPFDGTRRLMPNDEIKESELLALEMGKYFSTPGNYRITAVLCDREGCTDRSQPMSLMLTEPQGQDLQAYNFIKASNPDIFFVSREKRIMDQFVARFQSTPYNDYAQEVIGDDHLFFKRYLQAITAYEKISPQYAFAERIRQRIIDARKAIADAEKEAEEKTQ